MMFVGAVTVPPKNVYVTARHFIKFLAPQLNPLFCCIVGLGGDICVDVV
jgi:hypothetical protein